MSGEEEVYLVLPPGMGPPGCRAKLKVALYGTRRASYLWGEKVAEVIVLDDSSDDEDEVVNARVRQRLKQTPDKRRVVTIDDDDDDE